MTALSFLRLERTLAQGLPSPQALPNLAAVTVWKPSGESSLISETMKSLKTHLFPQRNAAFKL